MKLEYGAAATPLAAEPGTASLFIVNPFTGGGSLMQLFSTHPSTPDRIERLLGMAGGTRYRHDLVGPQMAGSAGR